MERIQSAIEKARAARSQRETASEMAHVSKAAVLPSASSKIEGSSVPDMIDGAWAAISPFTANKKTLKMHRIVASDAGPAAIPFDVMRTKLMQQMRINSWKRVAITSPSSACGKTMVSLNLAFSLARQSDVRIMVVELDLRRPSMARILGLGSKSSFASVLDGSVTAEANMVRIGSNLIFATNHSSARNPAELLQGARSAAVLDDIEERYRPDIVIFDMPPMLVNDDTIAFLDQVDCALLVGAAEKSTVEEIDRCEQELSARTHVLGVILNKCRYLETSEGYGYGSY